MSKHVISSNQSLDGTELHVLLFDDATKTTEWVKSTIGAKPGDFKKAD